MRNDKVRVFKRNKNRRRATKSMGWDFSFRLRSDGPLHKRSTTMSARTMDAVVVGTRAVAASGAKEKIDGGTSTCVYRHDTAIMQERAGCRRTTLALSYLSLAARTRGSL